MKNKKVGVIKDSLMNSINELFTKIENSSIDENEYLQYANELKKIYDNTNNLIHITEKELDKYNEDEDEDADEDDDNEDNAWEFRNGVVIHEECEISSSFVLETSNKEIASDICCVYEAHNYDNCLDISVHFLDDKRSIKE